METLPFSSATLLFINWYLLKMVFHFIPNDRRRAQENNSGSLDEAEDKCCFGQDMVVGIFAAQNL